MIAMAAAYFPSFNREYPPVSAAPISASPFVDLSFDSVLEYFSNKKKRPEVLHRHPRLALHYENRVQYLLHTIQEQTHRVGINASLSVSISFKELSDIRLKQETPLFYDVLNDFEMSKSGSLKIVLPIFNDRFNIREILNENDVCIVENWRTSCFGGCHNSGGGKTNLFTIRSLTNGGHEVQICSLFLVGVFSATVLLPQEAWDKYFHTKLEADGSSMTFEDFIYGPLERRLTATGTNFWSLFSRANFSSYFAIHYFVDEINYESKYIDRVLGSVYQVGEIRTIIAWAWKKAQSINLSMSRVDFFSPDTVNRCAVCLPLHDHICDINMVDDNGYIDEFVRFQIAAKQVALYIPLVSSYRQILAKLHESNKFIDNLLTQHTGGLDKLVIYIGAYEYSCVVNNCDTFYPQ
jgi:hypothetical protein